MVVTTSERETYDIGRTLAPSLPGVFKQDSTEFNLSRISSYNLPDNADETLSLAQTTATDELASLVATLYAEHGDDIEAVAREMKPCEYCETQHYEKFILRELLNRSLIELSEDGTLNDLL